MKKKTCKYYVKCSSVCYRLTRHQFEFIEYYVIADSFKHSYCVTYESCCGVIVLVLSVPQLINLMMSFFDLPF